MIFPEGSDIHGGWSILVEKLHLLWVVPIAEKKKLVFPFEKGCNLKIVNGSDSFVNVERNNIGLGGEATWLQLGEGEVQSGEKKLRKCLVGSFGEGLLLALELFAKRGLKASIFRGLFFCLTLKIVWRQKWSLLED